MKTPTTIILLFGVVVAQALPTSKPVKATSDFKDWVHEKRLLPKLGNDTVDNIKQGNRTKKSVICVDVQAPELDGCPPGCGEQPESPPPQGTLMLMPEPVFSYQPAPQGSPMFVPEQSFYQTAPQGPPMFVPEQSFSYQTAPQGPPMFVPEQSFSYQTAPQGQPMFVPEQSFSYQTAPQGPPPMWSAPQPLTPAPVMKPIQRPQQSMEYQPATAAPRPQRPLLAPSNQAVHQPAPPAPIMRPQPPQLSHHPVPQAPALRPQRPPSAPSSQVVYHTAPPAPITRPQSQGNHPPALHAPVMRPQAQRVDHQPVPQAPMMLQPQQVVHQPRPQVGYQQRPQPQQVVYQPPPQAPIVIPQFPVFLPPPPPPMQMPVMKEPRLLAELPKLPPCPPEEQYVIPGQDSQEIITYHTVPIKHYVKSSPSIVVTTERPPYPCVPPGASQPSAPQQSATSLTTVQQQSTVNQLQVVRANAYAAAPGNYEYPQSSGNDQQLLPSSSNYHQTYQPFGNSPSSQAPTNVHSMQLPPQNQGYSIVSGSPMMNDGGYAPFNQQQNMGSITPAQSAGNQQAGYQQSGYQQPVMTFSGQTVDCAQVPSLQNGAYGYQSSQSFAAAQSAAYSAYAASFRSAEDDNDRINATIPQLYQANSPQSHQYAAPSARFSSYGNNFHSKRDVTKKGSDKKVKA